MEQNHCTCLPMPFMVCPYCDNQFYTYLRQKKIEFAKIQKLNKSLNKCNCFWIFECKTCFEDILNWSRKRGVRGVPARNS